MRGLRTQENSDFVKFFKIVQNTASKADKFFFFDTGEGREIVRDGIRGEDLSGWLIPKEESELFEKEWKNWGDLRNWDDNYCWAVWENNKDITIKFEFYS